MSYSLSINLALGKSKTGLSLRSQLINTLGSDVGSEINEGFVEIANGYYMWTYDFPDSFQGGVKIYPNGQLSDVLGFFTLNPQEAENVDIKMSQLNTGSNNFNIEVGHSNEQGYVNNVSTDTSSPLIVTTGTRTNDSEFTIEDKGISDNNSNKLTVSTGVR